MVKRTLTVRRGRLILNGRSVWKDKLLHGAYDLMPTLDGGCSALPFGFGQ
jgi:hypothetical protein